MEITLTPKESEDYFYNALCNAVGTGYMASYGLEMDCVGGEKTYSAAQKKLQNPCYEDVLMQVLRDGGKLVFNDVEGEGDNTKEISLADVHARVCKTPMNHLSDMINENDDAVTADVLLQTVFFENVIFG